MSTWLTFSFIISQWCYILKRFYVWNNFILWSNDLFIPQRHVYLPIRVLMSLSSPTDVIPASCKRAWCPSLALPFGLWEYSNSFCTPLTTYELCQFMLVPKTVVDSCKTLGPCLANRGQLSSMPSNLEDNSREFSSRPLSSNTMLTPC